MGGYVLNVLLSALNTNKRSFQFIQRKNRNAFIYEKTGYSPLFYILLLKQLKEL